MAIQIQVRRGDSTLWTSSNPTLAEGEIGAELDTGRFKIGDGTTAWNSLGYSSDLEIGSIIGSRTYTEQNYVTNGETVTASIDEIDTTVASHMAEIASVAHGETPMAKIYNNLNQSIPNTTYATLVFNSEINDNEGFHDNSTNNSRLTIPRSGVYLFIANVVYGNNGTGRRNVRVYKNGVNSGVNILSQSAINSAMPYQFSSIVGLDVFNEGDYIEVEAYQASGSSLDVLTGETNFSIIKLG